jgi:hypothetical protein
VRDGLGRGLNDLGVRTQEMVEQDERVAQEVDMPGSARNSGSHYLDSPEAHKSQKIGNMAA